MELSREKINVALARKKMTIAELAGVYGASRARMNVMLNQRFVTPMTAGRMAEALGVDVTEIIETED